MKLANIVPPQWQGIFPQGEYRMALAHWVLEYPTYAKQLRKGSSYILLDNGTFEGEQVSYAQLNKACANLGADEVILPDVHGDPGETLRLSWSTLGKIASKRVMFVPQGTTCKEWEQCLRAWITKWDEASWGASYSLAIGITSLRRTRGKRSPQVGTRVGLLERYFSFNLPYPLHLLGVPDPKEFATSELAEARAMGVRGVDTSLAFALGAHQRLLTPHALKVHLGEPKRHESLQTQQRRLVYLNQRILQEWVNTGATEEIPTHWIRQTASKWLRYHAEGFAELKDVMQACGMPDGRYAFCKQKRREKYVRLLANDDALRKGETTLRLKGGKKDG